MESCSILHFLYLDHRPTLAPLRRNARLRIVAFTTFHIMVHMCRTCSSVFVALFSDRLHGVLHGCRSCRRFTRKSLVRRKRCSFCSVSLVCISQPFSSSNWEEQLAPTCSCLLLPLLQNLGSPLILTFTICLRSVRKTVVNGRNDKSENGPRPWQEIRSSVNFGDYIVVQQATVMFLNEAPLSHLRPIC